MGNYSYISDYEFTNNVEEFLKNIAPIYWINDKLDKFPSDVALPKDEELVLYKIGNTSDSELHLPEIKRDYHTGPIYIDIDGWKVQGYWYEGFCKMLMKFQEAGLRGYLAMDEETDQHFVINFNDDGVTVDIHEEAEKKDYPDRTDFETGEEYEDAISDYYENYIIKPSDEMPSTTHTINPKT